MDKDLIYRVLNQLRKDGHVDLANEFEGVFGGMTMQYTNGKQVLRVYGIDGQVLSEKTVSLT